MAYSEKKNSQRYFRRLSNSNSLTTWKSNKKFLMGFQIRCNSFKFRNKIIHSLECSIKKSDQYSFPFGKDKVSFQRAGQCVCELNFVKKIYLCDRRIKRRGN